MNESTVTRKVSHVLVFMEADHKSQTYNEAVLTTYPWGIHVLAIDQETFIPWHAIWQIDVVN